MQPRVVRPAASGRQLPDDCRRPDGANAVQTLIEVMKTMAPYVRLATMMICKTRFHGPIAFGAQDVLEIPSGLFGFADETQFLLLAVPSSRPIVFLQSVRSPKLCFISLPVQVIDTDYALSLNCTDLKRLGYSGAAPPRLGRDVLCLALLTIREGSVTTANLVAPIVIDIKAHRGVQVLMKKQYSHRHPVPAAESRLVC